MKVSISKGNSKIGSVPNVSLPPGKSCVENVPCFREGCYAKKAMIWPNVIKAWGGNLEYAEADLVEYMRGILDYVRKMRPEMFRWHVSGDILNQEYWHHMNSIAMLTKSKSFLCFTKQYDLCYDESSSNLIMVLSTWPTLDLPKNEDIPWAWIEGDSRIPKDKPYLRCPGNCYKCGHKCWRHLSKDLHVVFPKH